MRDIGRRFLVLFVVLFVSGIATVTSSAEQTHKTHKNSSASKKETVRSTAQSEDAPASSTPAPTPEEMPATPAQVTYQNNQLTILARNSTVGDILRAVRKQTGATVDAPPDAKQRVVGQFGPGPARDVLASVLDASGFNYVLLGSPANPDALQSVIVSVKSNEPPTPPSPNPAEANNPSEQPDQSSQAEEPDQSTPSESFTTEDNNDSNNNGSSTNDSGTEDDSQEQTQPPPKSPEQLLQELQRQQQIQQLQLQQQQQMQNGGSPQGETPAQPDQMH